MNTDEIEKLTAQIPIQEKNLKKKKKKQTRMDIYRPFSRPRTPMIESRLNFLI